jgi:hypothetical protein
MFFVKNCRVLSNFEWFLEGFEKDVGDRGYKNRNAAIRNKF